MDSRDFDRLTQFLGRAVARSTGRRDLVLLTLSLVTRHPIAPHDAAARPRAGKHRRERDAHGEPAAEGPCGNGSVRRNACKRHGQCCTGFCDKQKGRCRCQKLGETCTEDRACCASFGQPMNCLNGTCQATASPLSPPPPPSCPPPRLCGLTCCPQGQVCGSNGACVDPSCCGGSATCGPYTSVDTLCCIAPLVAGCCCDSALGAGDGFVRCCTPDVDCFSECFSAGGHGGPSRDLNGDGICEDPGATVNIFCLS